MKVAAIAIIIALCITACNAQETAKKSGEQAKIKEEVKNMPKESWTVKKEVDDEGNIIGYDSTYSWSYTNTNGDSVSVDVDSVMRSFDRYFQQHFPSVFGRSLINPNWDDSLFNNDFFQDDFQGEGCGDED